LQQFSDRQKMPVAKRDSIIEFSFRALIVMQFAMLHCSLTRNDNAVSWLVSSPGRIFSARSRSPEPSHKTDAECRAAIGTLARQPTTNSKIFGNPLIVRDPEGHRAIRNLGQPRESRIPEVICGRSIPDIRSPPQL
jgi:hypothetical protein